MLMPAARKPAVWFPTIRAGTGADVFTERLVAGLLERDIRAEITWLPLRAEYAPWSVSLPQTPAWANIVHVNSWLPQRYWPKGMPTVVTVHHLVHDPAYRPYRSRAQMAYHELLIRRRELRAILDAAAVVTDSNYVRRTVTEFSGREQITTIHICVDCKRFSPASDGSHLDGGPFRLFMAGSHSKRKGFDLLPSFVQALGAGFEVRYAGSRTGGGSAIAGVTELGRISEDALIVEYRRCDAVVSLSRYEGFGYTALEAMACGKPFLGFETSALPEVVAKEGGVLVPVDDLYALAAAARDLRSSPSGADAMGSCGRQRALNHFNMDKIDSYVSTYSSLLQTHDLMSGAQQKP